MKATQKQIDFAEAIAEELGIDMPEELSIGEVSDFIAENKDDFYQSQRERKGGYAAMWSQIDHKEI